MASAFFVTLFTIIPPSQVRRRDGTPLAHYPHEGFWQELKNQRRLFQDWRILVLFIPMFASEVPFIVISSCNCKLKSPKGITLVVSDADSLIACSTLLQHTYQVSQLGDVQLHASRRGNLDRIHAG